MLWWVLLALGVFLALIATFRVGARMGKSYDGRKIQRDLSAPRRICSTCGADMEFQGITDYMTEQGSRVSLETYVCGTCRKVDNYLPPAAIED